LSTVLLCIIGGIAISAIFISPVIPNLLGDLSLMVTTFLEIISPTRDTGDALWARVVRATVSHTQDGKRTYERGCFSSGTCPRLFGTARQTSSSEYSSGIGHRTGVPPCRAALGATRPSWLASTTTLDIATTKFSFISPRVPGGRLTRTS
jgi:hypothetical protein